ncbi:MAG: NADH-ubiquinone oxidoreductase-F iron-sulfur binding region domain-containing protein [Myxococcota bacterium]
MRILEWSRRRSGGPVQRHVLQELREGKTAEQVEQEHGLPRAWVDGLTSFYDLLHGERERACTGTSCSFPDGCKSNRKSELEGVHCLGQCYAPPATTLRAPPPIPRRSMLQPPVVLRNILGGEDARGEYVLPDGETILGAVEASGLRGRGGAAFPTAAKWKAARDTPAPDRYVVANGDEGDPGSFVDRLLLEEAPHAVLAGMKACARAIGARKGIVFIRGEYPDAHRTMRKAIDEARDLGLLGQEFDVELFCCAGSYVAGEETALLRAIEGLRSEPAVKPPYPAQCGLQGLPTVVQNVETLAVIPWVVRHRRRGDAKALSVAGAVGKPGVVEIRLGTTLRTVLEEACDGPRHGARWKMALVGGPLGRVVPVSGFDVPLSYDGLPGMGHGGIVVLDDTVTARELAEHLFTFARRESCGNCTPCRVGTSRLHTITDRPALERLMTTLEAGSLCGFGQGVPRPIRDLLQHFPGEMFP